ncbi:MAG: phosphoribosylaminoimidazolesuccinocarboxamide synthase [Candidatus Omnitrophica bacterium]|nr:phosphoribosylaminoimidazolesuccinocarboxamide synthase [Candidatus Omnitrophota bacterium]
MSEKILLTSNFKDLVLFRRGKVRDLYDLGNELLIISCDRISCFDVVLPSGIPYKGKVLTQLSCFWFGFLKGVVKNHFITADVREYPAKIRRRYKKELDGRSMLVLKTKPLPVECVVRGYLAGSGWKEYKEKQSICGINLPAGLRESEKLPTALFTPSTKEDKAHDVNVDQKYVEMLVGKETSDKIRKLSIEIYMRASEYAAKRGIIIADTKFEFGVYNGEVILIDEVLTPDSSRFWPADHYAPGKAQPSFDKQFVRDYLEELGWDKTPPAPALPAEIIKKTSQKYLEAYRRLTGKNLNIDGQD